MNNIDVVQRLLNCETDEELLQKLEEFDHIPAHRSNKVEERISKMKTGYTEAMRLFLSKVSTI